MSSEIERYDRYREFVRSTAYRRERPEKARVIARLCRDELRRASRIADLGSGTGIIKKELEIIFSKPLIGVEIDGSFMESAERMILGDVLRLPIADESLEFVIANHLYEHVVDQPGLFREIHRVLVPGGAAYVSAGNRLALIEPHYRLPFLSWLPRPAADLYLRLSGRGRAYRGIRFRTHRPLVAMMRDAGLRVRDATEQAVDELISSVRGPLWRGAWAAVRRLPAGARHWLLRRLSPQWFFLAEKPAPGGGARVAPEGRSSPGSA